MYVNLKMLFVRGIRTIGGHIQQQSFVPVRQVQRAIYKAVADWNEEDNRSIQQNASTFTYCYLRFYGSVVLPSRLGFGSTLPFCAEKRSVLLHESEEIFVALLGKHPSVVTKTRQLSRCCAAVLLGF
jgi:hypothetical protein